jgi:hypothetical protein
MKKLSISPIWFPPGAVRVVFVSIYGRYLKIYLLVLSRVRMIVAL